MSGHSKNLIALIAIQGSNASLPLLVFPYALSMLGSASYADLVFAEALSFLAIAIVLYSFEIDGVADVAGLSVERDRSRISRVFSRVLYTRLCLFFLAAPVLVVAIACYRPELGELAAWWMLVPLSYALQPTWMFQGLQHNTAPAICTLLSRFAAVMLVLLLVVGPEDTLLLPQIIGLSYIGGSLAQIAWAIIRLKFRLMSISCKEMLACIKTGKEIFLGNIGVVLYRDSNVLLLGLVGLAGVELAAYSLAEKITKAMQAVIRPLNQLFFPRAVLAVRAVGAANLDALSALFRLTWPQLLALAFAWGGLYLIIQLGMTYFAQGTRILELHAIISLAAIMSLATFFGVGNFMFGSAGLNILGERRVMLYCILLAAATSVGSTIILGSLFGAMGAALSLVLAEGFLCLLIIQYYMRSAARR
ncbi:oligosaccharide flippase family protein [Pseudomonas sp. PA27(2017)]|uniref:oligosaccharide flippase family protein n=1 Tax=Pseudomonas sp. PA27(2017) TaxID=1932112 RepID=UPI0009698D6A|nr:oligosaccharide flippase family protein [Pseudomonas sp. PA27(2017)]OLU33072.1 hypothetical protein BVH06_09430 [Pseudomonas sp. PA27(2017)]